MIFNEFEYRTKPLKPVQICFKNREKKKKKKKKNTENKKKKKKYFMNEKNIFFDFFLKLDYKALFLKSRYR